MTITAPNTFAAGQQVSISNVTPAGYNGTFTILTATPTLFTYTAASGLTSPSVGPGFAVINASLANYTGASNTISPITPTSTATLTAANAGQDVKLTANVTVPVGGLTINSLDLNGFNVSGSATLTVSSGGVINSRLRHQRRSPGRRSQRQLLR